MWSYDVITYPCTYSLGEVPSHQVWTWPDLRGVCDSLVCSHTHTHTLRHSATHTQLHISELGETIAHLPIHCMQGGFKIMPVERDYIL